MSDVREPQLFLLGQQLSELVGVTDADQRRFDVCGGVSEKIASDRRERSEAPRDPWVRLERSVVQEQATGREPRKRVALVCDAGLGKTTNLEWLAAAITRQPGHRQIPLLLRLNTTHDLNLLVNEHTAPDTLLERLATLVKKCAGGEAQRHRQALARKQTSGQITLLLDGLDHALSQSDIPKILWEVLQSHQWQNCPVWIAGRPYAFDSAWGLFSGPEWHFLRVEPLAEADIRFYLSRHAGGDWYDDIAPEGRGLLAVPRLLRLTARMLEGAVQAAGDGAEDRRAIVRNLDLRTAADVYDLAYFTPGEWVDPKHWVPGQERHVKPQGLIASGLTGPAECIGLRAEEQPSRTNYQRRIDRTAAILGAIAFEMFATNADPARPEPNTVGVPEEQLETFLAAVSRRLLAAGGRADLDFGHDFEPLVQMNNGPIDFLLFRELGQKGLVWHDRTVQAFFAAYWAMKFGAEQDRQLMKSWVVDAVGAPLGGFDDFWTFAVQMPDVHVEKSRWLTVFAPCYASPQWLQGAAEWVQWCRRMIYYSFASMQARSPETIAQWRASFEALANGTTKQKRIHREIEDGFRDIPAGICPFGGDSLEREQGEARRVSAFRMHQWPVTNEVYEEFDPAHWKQRWRNARNDAEHPLAKKRGRSGEDRCPVVNVSWYDAWCFAVWCGHRLPTELEWEHACRAGSESAWYFGNEEDELKNHAWCSEAWKGGSTHPVGGLLPNGNGLYDMHGNVWEWCVDPREPWASHRVLRGGSWFLRGEYCRCAYRLTYNPDFRSQYYGFRLAAIPDGAKLVQQRHA